VATHAFTAITDTNGANVVIGNLPADGPSLIVGTDGNWYTSGTTYDSTTNTPVSPAIAYMPQGGGAASAIVVPSTIVGLSSVLQSAPGQLVLLSQGPNDLDGVVTFVNESTHSFGASFDDPVSGSTAMFGSYTAALTGPSGQPAGVAFSETTDTIGIYVPGD
jgi:hypothetical protein